MIVSKILNGVTWYFMTWQNDGELVITRHKKKAYVYENTGEGSQMAAETANIMGGVVDLV